MPFERSQGKRCAIGRPWAATNSSGSATIPTSMLMSSQSLLARVSLGLVYGVSFAKGTGTLRSKLACGEIFSEWNGVSAWMGNIP